MPIEITLGNPPAGYAAEASRAADETAEVRYREFTSTEDGQHFIQRLEGWPTKLLDALPPAKQILPSQVDNMLALFRRDGSATVYLNEVCLRGLVRVARACNAGEAILKDDITEIEAIDLGVEVPLDNGFLWLFSVGWRKGMFYDFGPLAGPHGVAREYDHGHALAHAYAHVAFQERFSVSEAAWDALFTQQWFMFIGLKHSTLEQMVSHAKEGWSIDELTPQIADEVRARIPAMLTSWETCTAFQAHMAVLKRAVEHFVNADYLSCTSLLFPRIEGILRTHVMTLRGDGASFKPSALSDSAVSSKLTRPRSLLLPHKFAEYLRTVYFASFNPLASDHTISRHTVAHGVADASKFDLKAALIGVLVVHQLFYFMSGCHTAPR